MPELPEVETMVRGLRLVMEGRRLVSARVTDSILLDSVSRRRFERTLSGNFLLRVWRRGKWVILELAGGQSAVIQPRMTGTFRVGTEDAPAHGRVHFCVDGPHQNLWFCDVRRLGRISLHDANGLAERLSERHHGPEATSIRADQLSHTLKGTRRPVKAALLDQRVVSGVGNIYADEALFDSRIHPERRGGELTNEQVTRLARSIRQIMKVAIELQGTTMRNYFNVFGEAGSFQDRHRVYGRAGDPCTRCGTPIVRANILGLMGRSTHFCRCCQRME